LLDKLLDIFSYSSKEPLIFTRFYFWAFFAIAMAGYSIIYRHRTPKNAYLLLLSLFFYYKSSGVYLILLVLSIIANFYIANGIFKSKKRAIRAGLVSLSVFINLFTLSYFKYAYLFIDTINYIFGSNLKVVNHFNMMVNSTGHFALDIDKIILPVGISFFTFQIMCYVIDIYRNKFEPVKSIVDFGFYVSFFPQLVAGPIVRASEFIPQIYKEYTLSKQEFGLAVFMILNGLLKKLFISDYIAVNLIDRVFSNPVSYTGLENLMALYAYSMQVYADFSGYTDIAIGVALLMGYRLSANFNSPYKALHVGEFWKRWHISLSTWLKDYLYIPLGGNKHGEFRTNLNLMITMLLGGLWHGASWQFVIWGGLNGLGLLIYKQWKKISPFTNDKNWLVRFYAIFLTFNFITLTRIWFRGESMQKVDAMIGQIVNAFKIESFFEIILAYKNILALLAFAFIIHWLPESFKKKYRELFAGLPLWAMSLVVIIVIIFIYQFQTFELQPFIYFVF
jgi:alginate O-acetyltransferase complex protein AlgI